MALALAAAQRGAAPVENELSSAVAGPARTHGRAAAEAGRALERDARPKPLSPRSVRRPEMCARSTPVVSQRTTRQKEGTSCLPM